MAGRIKLEEYTSSVPEPQWLNQVRVTMSMGKRYEQKGDMEKAANCYETVLNYEPKDTKTRIKLSKCYQKMLQLEQAVKHQSYAMQNDPHLFQTTENEASLNFELGNYEQCLIAYNQYAKQWKTSYDCKRGLLKVNEVIENNLPVNGLMNCLKYIMLEMIDDGQLFKNSSIPCKMVSKGLKLDKFRQTHIERSQEAYYLRYTTENFNYFRKQLDDLPKRHANDKLIYDCVGEIVHTFEKAKRDLYRQKPFYMVKCQQPNRQLNDPKKLKDTIKLQVAKYTDTIVQYCLAGDITLARKQSELLLKYMESRRYKPLKIVNALYEVYGLALYSVNQELLEWSSELNDQRILFILGSDIDRHDAYRNVFRESYFGPRNYNTRNELKKLCKQLNETECSTYSLYLQYERIKCYLELNEFKEMSVLSKRMFTDACDSGSIAWQVNALMMTVISESRLNNVLKCMKTLEFLIPLSRTLGNKMVTQFLRKIWKLFAEDRLLVRMMSAEEKRKADLVDIMPDSETAQHMRDTLHRIDKLPPECRMPLSLGEPPEMNCKFVRGRVGRNVSLTSGREAKRLETRQ